MALHIVVNGMTSGQRMQKTKKDPFLDEVTKNNLKNFQLEFSIIFIAGSSRHCSEVAERNIIE